MNHRRILSPADDSSCLDPVQLSLLEQNFRAWAAEPASAAVRAARRRILLVFLLIRYTGAKLSEVLSLNPRADIDTAGRKVIFSGSLAGEGGEQRKAGGGSGMKAGGDTGGRGRAMVGEVAPAAIAFETIAPEGAAPDNSAENAEGGAREVPLADVLAGEIRILLDELGLALPSVFGVDPGFVRRKFYERAESCGFVKHLGGPEKLRKARAVELMQGDMPLPVVQRLLGHSSPNLTSAYVSFSAEDTGRVARFFMEKESGRKTSARNSFFGKVRSVAGGETQALVELATLDGHLVSTMITAGSLERLGIRPGVLITAEIKAPWVMLEAGEEEPRSSAENRYRGTITRVLRGALNTECVARLSDSTEVCAVLSSKGFDALGAGVGDAVWVLFSCYAVVLHTD